MINGLQHIYVMYMNLNAKIESPLMMTKMTITKKRILKENTMKYFYNCKKLFLLLFLLLPSAGWAMFKKLGGGKQQTNVTQKSYFCLVVDSKHKRKCRLLHRLLNTSLSSKVLNSSKSSKVFNELADLYKALGVVELIHNDFTVIFKEDIIHLENQSNTHSSGGFRRCSDEQYLYEDVVIKTNILHNLNGVSKVLCEKLPFSARVFDQKGLMKWYTNYLVSQYENENENENLITFDNDDNDNH